MSTKIKALTLHQPWASLIAIGSKCVETRSWPTHYRGPLAIHAGKTSINPDRIMWATEYLSISYSDPKRLPLGQVVALATLADVQPITEASTPDEPERFFGDYTPGRFAWYLEDVRPLTLPIAAKGGRRFWEWDIVEAMARAAHETTDLEEYGRLMSQAHAVLSRAQYAAFFTKFLQLRDGEIQ